MNNNKENNREGKSQKEQSAADLDKMISDMEKRISEIEMEEMLSGYTTEELSQMGFIGNNSIDIEHSKYLKNKFAEGYEFPEDVNYQKYYPVKSVEQIESIDLSDITVIHPDTVAIKLTIAPNKVNYYNKEFNDEQYKKECYLNFKKENSIFIITPKVPGRLVLAGQRLYLIPADRDGKCVVRISDDCMAAYADFYQATGNGAKHTEEMILNELQLSGVKTGIKMEAIREALTRIKTSKSEKKHTGCPGKVSQRW